MVVADGEIMACSFPFFQDSCKGGSGGRAGDGVCWGGDKGRTGTDVPGVHEVVAGSKTAAAETEADEHRTAR